MKTASRRDKAKQLLLIRYFHTKMGARFLRDEKNRAGHRADQLAHDGKTHTAPLAWRRRRALALDEGLEDTLPVFFGDTANVTDKIKEVDVARRRTRAEGEGRTQYGTLVTVGEHLTKGVRNEPTQVLETVAAQ